MRAVTFEELGGPEVLQVVDLPEPQPGPGEVAIEVSWAGVNFADAKARSVGYRVDAFPFHPGLEVSGTVRALGEGVTGLSVGQHVFAMLNGKGYAETVVARAATTFAVPEALDLRDAAALGTVLATGYGMLHDVGRVREGDTVLIQGAAGGVGTVTGQLARAAGAGRVLGVVSRPEKAAYAKEFGYDEILVGEDFDEQALRATDGRGVDLALDPVGGESWRRSVAALARFGRAICFGNASDADAWSIGMADLAVRGLSVSGFSILGLAATDPARLRVLTETAFREAERAGITIPVTGEFPLERAGEAQTLLESRTSTGKLLLKLR
ncbi:quinone oxidoreductase family protein [Streptacidiphilus jiangxiensis]|uniref:NADPH2:quinone reductase n=1 Tax=Streptacidiphilus jiangxiensis TaxID=235985 RepID=A0A1H7RZE2_STRJI|nr:zinc-binding dehydrogenase [Streptacidiphilus jiangxiensis]SEL65476.1 NADPH2:quinone reductase [Streptacidiphilus jiangxiensis]